LKILIATDGSRHSEMAYSTLRALKLPPQTKFMVMTVVPEHTFLGGITLHMLRGDAAAREQAHKAQDEKAALLLEQPAELMRKTGASVETIVRRGNPAEQIIKQAHEFRADLVAVGAKGITDSRRFPLGSVAQKVMKYSATSVLIAREQTAKIRQVLLAIDGSKYSDAAGNFLLELPLPLQSHVVFVTSLQSHVATLIKMPTLDLDINQKILAELRSIEEDAARNLMAKTVQQFQDKGYDTESIVLRGEPAAEILMASKTINPDLIVLGARGLSGIEGFLLGSVAQRVARFSRYSVLIVRSPKS